MKTKLFSLILGCGAVLAGTLTGCSSDDEGGQIVAPPKFTAQQKAVSNEMKDFDFDFFEAVNREQGDRNFVVSPLSASMLLSMLANGESDEVQQQICDALGTDDVATLNTLAKEYQNWLPRADRNVRLSLANSVWYTQDLKLNPAFSSVVSEFFDAPAYARDFSNSDALIRDINKWASQKTNGLIPEFLKTMDANTVAFLFNAMYFKGKWTDKFDKKETVSETFHGLKGDADVMMMYNRHDRAYAWGEDFQAVSLGFGEGRLSARVIMPDEGVDLNEFIADGRIAEVIRQRFEEYDVKLGLPRFKITPQSNMNLDKVFAELGIEGLAAPHKSRIFDGGSNTLTRCNQQCTAEFNEEGAEAAAVTDGEIGVTAPGPNQYGYVEVTFNRPFVFLIMENTTGRVLFAGKVANL